MIGAPSDIQKEVQMVKDAISCWNQTNSMHRNIVLMPLHWKSNAYSSVGTSGQSVINDQVTNKSDLLVAIFGSRLGAPTEDHISGTVEEIQQHIRNNKKVMLFFRENNLSPKSEDERVQLNKLFDFKKEIQSKCLWYDYKDEGTFPEAFSQQLNLWVNRELTSLVQDDTSVSIVTQCELELDDDMKSLYSIWANSQWNILQFTYLAEGEAVRLSGAFISNAGDNKLLTSRGVAKVKEFCKQLVTLRLAEESVDSDGRLTYALTSQGYKYFDENLSNTK